MSDHSDSEASPKGSDESANSDGVLVELPPNPDQEEQPSQIVLGLLDTPDNGILVNIDGSTQDDSREDMFEDATDEPATMETPRGLEESIAMIDIGESSSRRDAEEIARMQARLDDAVAECKKYREEREVFGREVANLRQQLLDITDSESLFTSSEDADIPLPTPLHAMLSDCSKYALHLKNTYDKSDLKELLLTKERELEDLKMKNIESNVSHGVIFSYLDSLHDSWSETLKERLLPFLNTVIGEEGSTDGTHNNALSLVEKKTLSLVEIHRQFLSEIDQLRQCLAGVMPEYENMAGADSTNVLTVATTCLVEAKKRETDYLDVLNKLKYENEGLLNEIKKLRASLDVVTAETSKVKGELEQAENKYLAVKEKLSMAVTKGKSLVQTRDSLKQSLAEKNGELEKRTAELKEKSNALHSSEVRVEELQKLLEEKTSEVESCMQQLQAKEATAEELRGFIAEKSGAFETCMQELKVKSDELRASEQTAEELRKLLEEKITGFESCMEELQATKITVEELQKSLEEKNTEYEMCAQELKTKLEELQATKITVEELQKSLEEKNTEYEICAQELKTKLEELHVSEVKVEELQATKITVEELQKSLEEKNTEYEICAQELKTKLEELHVSEVKVEELQELLEEKRIGLEMSTKQTSTALQDAQDLLEVKSSELDRCMLELQQKSDLLQANEIEVEELKKVVEEKVSELEKLSMESQQKINHSQATEDTIKGLAELLEEKKSELERREHELQASEFIVQELQKVLEEKKSELDRCAFDLQQQSDVLQATELTVKQLQQSLDTNETMLKEQEKLVEEKVIYSLEMETTIAELKKLLEEQRGELEKSSQESKERSVELETIKAGMHELSNSESKLASIQLSLSEKENKLQDLETILREFSYPDDIDLSDTVEKVRWIADQNKSVVSKVKDVLAPVAFPESVSSTEIDSQINWLIESLNQAREDATKVKEESSLLKSQLNALDEEIIRLSKSLSEEKQARDALSKEVTELSVNLSNISSEKSKLVKALEESFHIKYDSEENPSAEIVIENFVSSLKEAAKLSLIDSVNLEKLQSLLYERDQELDLCKKLLEEDAAGKTEIKVLNEEVERLKNEKDSLQKELERVEEKNALVREKLSMAVKKGKGLVAEREAKNAEIIALKNDIESRDSVVKNLREQIEQISSQLTHVNVLESEVFSLKEKLDEAKNSIKESEIAKDNLLRDLSEATSKSHTLEHEIGNAKERISNITKEKEEILFEKNAMEHELERVKEEASTSASKLTDAFITIKSLEDALSEAKTEAEAKHEKEISELCSKLADCTEELKETQEKLQRSLLDRSNGIEKMEEVMKDHETLLSMVKEEFRGKINSLRGMGLLMHDMHQQFSAKGYSIDPSIEVSGFAKFLSLPSYDKFINERNARNNSAKRDHSEITSITSMADSLFDQSKHTSEYLKDLSIYMDDHITLMSQVLQATGEEFFHIMDSEDNLKLELERLEQQYKAQEDKLKKAVFGSERVLEDRQFYEDKISTLEKNCSNLEGVCNEMKSKIEDYKARESLLQVREEELALLEQGSTKDRGLAGLNFTEDEMLSLLDKVKRLEIPYEPELTPIEKVLYILDQFSELNERVDLLANENADLQSVLESNTTELHNLKGEHEIIHQSLEKIVQKLVQLGGKDIIQDQKQATTMAFLSFLEKALVSLVHEYESSKAKLMEMEGKLQTREKMVAELLGRVKILEESYQSWATAQTEVVARDRSLVEASSSSRNSDEIEDLGPIGKSSISSTAARMTTRKVSSDHLILNVGGETEHLVAAHESEDKGHVFKSLNTSGLIPVQGKFIADKVDSAWVSGSRVLMSQPRARLGAVAYCLFLHLWFLGSIVF